uniref:Cuticle protein n=1 Tax=Timema monikensis TaxID=170555 RepID=A0A7R9EB79_9NEOP|nr:unnamed protein product [Timema monikensis]
MHLATSLEVTGSIPGIIPMVTRILLILGLVSTIQASPELFPFSNLKQYFDHQTKNGPGNTKLNIVPSMDLDMSEEPSETVLVSVKVKEPVKDALLNSAHANHKLDTSVSSSNIQTTAEASPVAVQMRPILSQVLTPPALIHAIEYAELMGDQPNTPIKVVESIRSPIPQTIDPISQFESQKNHPALTLIPPVPSQFLQTPPISSTYNPIELIPLKSGYLPVQTSNESYKPNQVIKSSSPMYPKKYRPELEQENQKKGSHIPKTKKQILKDNNYHHVKQQKQSEENIAATVQAANFQKNAAPSFHVPVKIDPTAGEQTAEASGFSHASTGLGGPFSGQHQSHGLTGLEGSNDRVDFQMHGHHGPHSYKFGYDTGKGHNRQFRYEERDTHGHVKGHYGFYNKHGKLQMVSYSAHPEHGFHADNNFGKDGV